jgi:hypothetical protein
MLAKEPILLLISLYMGLVYGILYLFFEAYPISFQEVRGWNGGVGALPFIGIMIGVIFGSIAISIATKTRFARKLKKYGHVIPEERLPPMIAGAFLLPIGLFWFAWTSNPNISWVPQVIAGIPIGMGMCLPYSKCFFFSATTNNNIFFRNLHDLHPRLELHHRCVYDASQLGYCGQHVLPIYGWCRIPIVRHRDVP